MGAVTCSQATVPDLLGEHEAADAEVASISDGQNLDIVAKASVIALGEAHACRTDRSALSIAASTVETVDKVKIIEENDDTSLLDVTGATETPEYAHAEATEMLPGERVIEANCNHPEGHAEHIVPTTALSISVEASSTVALDHNKEPVPPVLVLCRYLQADKKAADAKAPPVELKSKAPAIEPEGNAPAPLVDIQAAFMDEMAAGTEGHKYDQAEIGRLAEELGSMSDPRALYTKTSEALDTTDSIPSKKKTVKKRAADGSSEAKAAKADSKKQLGGSAAKPKRRERLPGCSVKAEIAKHMTQEELDDHEERRERWMKAEMRKIKQREDINQRMDTACHQQ